MSTELIQSLSNDHSRAQVEALLRGALREPAFAELGALLYMWIEEHPGPFAALCRETGAVAVDGWDALGDALVARGPACTAIGVDLSGYWDATGPGLEVSLYSDAVFPFSTSDRAALLTATDGGTPVWQGRYEHVEPLLTCSGLETLDAALRDYPHRHWNGGTEMPDDFPAYFAAAWFLYLRVNVALAEALGCDPLPRRVPVLIGQNDYGPAFETVYLVELVAPVACDAPVIVPVDETPPTVAVEQETPTQPVAEAEPEAEIEEASEPSTPARGWPWRRSSVRQDSGETATADPITQRRRGPGSFAA